MEVGEEVMVDKVIVKVEYGVAYVKKKAVEGEKDFLETEKELERVE